MPAGIWKILDTHKSSTSPAAGGKLSHYKPKLSKLCRACSNHHAYAIDMMDCVEHEMSRRDKKRETKDLHHQSLKLSWYRGVTMAYELRSKAPVLP